MRPQAGDFTVASEDADPRLPIVMRHVITLSLFGELQAGDCPYGMLERFCAAGYFASMRLSSVIHSDPEILDGTPVFIGTRVPAQSLFDHLEAGDSIDDFLEGFPTVRREQVIAVLEEFRKELLTPA